MKLNKKTERLIKRRAAEFKKLYETPNPEVDKIISELRAEATKRPQNRIIIPGTPCRTTF